MQNHERRDDDIGQTSKEIIFDLPPDVSKKSASGAAGREPLLDTIRSDVREPLLDTLHSDAREPLLDTLHSDAFEFPVEAGDAREPRLEKGASTPVVNPFFLWLQRAVAVLSIFAISVLVFLGAVSAVRIVIDELAARSGPTPNTQPAAKLDVPSSAAESHMVANAQPPGESDVETNKQPSAQSDLAPADEGLTQSEGSFDFGTPSAAPSFAAVNISRSNVRRKRPRRLVKVAGYESVRPARPTPQPLVPLFFPTTLVIYVENGVIKTRVEPWLQTTPLPNH